MAAGAGAPEPNVDSTKTNATSNELLFAFERGFDHIPFHDWMQTNWTLAFWCSLVYLLLILALSQWYMPQRKAFNLQRVLFAWNISLAVFSTAGAARTLPELLNIICRHPEGGWVESICNPSFNTERPTNFWMVAFAISKVIELGDTFFIVLRRRPLIFLHWYHHVTVLIYVWYSYTDFTAPGRWFVAVNYAIHSVMYSYYAVRALQMRIPRQISMFVTGIQIIQMVIGIVVTWSAYRIRRSAIGGVRWAGNCHQTYENMGYCVAMYVSYLILFGHFFYKTYLQPTEKKILKQD